MSLTLCQKYRTITPECCNSITFALPAQTIDNMKETGQEWFYPGCGQSRIFTEKSEAQVWRETAQTWMRRHDCLEYEAREATNKLGKLRARIREGLCPCCDQAFGNLRAHIAEQHPEYGASSAVRVLRQGMAMSQYELEEELGLPHGYVSAYENDKALPDYATRTLQE